jgi:IS5 family transposase
LQTGTLVDATSVAAPSSTKNKDKARDPEMGHTCTGKPWPFGAKAHIGADADSALVHSFELTAANVADVTQTVERLHGEETRVHADAGYSGVPKREEAKDLEVDWSIAEQRGKVLAMQAGPLKEPTVQAERLKATIRARVEHPFHSVPPAHAALPGAREDRYAVARVVRPGQPSHRQEGPVGLMRPRCARHPSTPRKRANERPILATSVLFM